jgi:hypothetical protein
MVGLIDPGQEPDIGTALHRPFEVVEGGRVDGDVDREGIALIKGNNAISS